MSGLVVAAVLVAGALGALARYGVGILFANRTGFPWAVFIVNVLGSAIGGWMLALQLTESVEPRLALVVLTGLCGGLTTFSTWSVETIQLALEGKYTTAVKNVVVGIIAGLSVATITCVITIWVLASR
jgi:fluoride exporter